MLERKRSELEARRADEQRSTSIAVGVAGGVMLAAALIIVGVIVTTSSHPAPHVTPSAVEQFTDSLPESQHPNAAGVTVVDGLDAPNSWRVAWETEDAAFCFAFVHEDAPAQTMCDAPGSVTTAKMRIAGELDDSGVAQPALFACGYTTDLGVDVGYADIDDGEVVGEPADIGSGLAAFCLELPEDITAGQSFRVHTYEVTAVNGKNVTSQDVTATYP